MLDDNDSEPQFLEPLDGVITVREEQQAGFEVVQVHATDADDGENATITYSFRPGETVDCMFSPGKTPAQLQFRYDSTLSRGPGKR